VITYLKEKGMWDDTLIIFTSDNGADTHYGDNFPLRGEKQTVWNGGLQVPAFVTGGVLPADRRGTSLDEMIHVTDWFPTILSAVGIDYDNSNLDGMNVWDTIKSGTVSDEQEDREIVLYLNPNECNLEVCGAMYWQNFKFVYTNVGTTTNDDSSSCYWKDQFASKKDSSVLGCTGLQSNSDVSCDCATTACLFDLSSDPCETINVF